MASTLDSAITGLYDAVYLNPQTAMGTVATDYDGNDAVGVSKASATSGKTYSISEERGAGYGRSKRRTEERHNSSWSIEGDLPVAGSAGGASDLADMLSSGGMLTRYAANSTTVSGGSSTTTGVDVVDASGYTANASVVLIDGEARLVTAVDTAATPDRITVSPALSSAPSDTVAVTGVDSYVMDNTTPEPVGLTGHMYGSGGRYGAVCRSMVVGKLNLEQGTEGALRYMVEGIAQSISSFTYTTSDGSYGTGATTIGVNDANFPVNSRIVKQGGTETGMVVTNDYDSSPDVTRGSNPDSLSADDVLVGYLPAPTVQVDTVAAVAGQSFVNGVQIPDMGAKCEVDFDLQYSGERGNDKTFSRVHPGLVSVSLTLSGVQDRSSFNALERSLFGTLGMAMAQWGTEAGKVAAIFLPNALRTEQRTDEIGDTGLVNLEATFEGVAHDVPFVLAL